MTHRIIGTCSLCGGQVGVPTVWMSVNPPRPTCLSCGAVAEMTGPVIPMRKREPATGRKPVLDSGVAFDLDEI